MLKNGVYYEDGVIHVQKPREPFFTAIQIAIAAVLSFSLLLGGFSVIIVGLKIAILDGIHIGYLVAIFFSIAMIPGVAGFFWLMYLLFDYRLEFNPSTGAYHLRNGIIHLKLRIKTKYKVYVFQTYSRGDWGYGSRIIYYPWKYAIPIILPFIPSNIVGSKQRAYKEVSRILDILKKAVDGSQVDFVWK